MYMSVFNVAIMCCIVKRLHVFVKKFKQLLASSPGLCIFCGLGTRLNSCELCCVIVVIV